jgi:NAD(P)-dependent dehydrogenase (short-subunit alcohol dehydrogenase family)
MIIVTGGGTGIGAAVSRRAARAGQPVCVNYRTDADSARDVVDGIRAEGGTAISVAGDVGDPDDVDRLFTTAIAELGPLTALVNNAGITGGTASVLDIKPDQLDTCYHACLRSVVLCTRAAARHMARSRGGQGGAIVNISSTSARTGGSGEWVHYAALKAAVSAHTVGAARELASEGIRVNAVAPGLVRTGLHAANGMPDRPDRLRSSIPLGRLGEPEEIAEGVWFLCSGAASYASGAVLEICGAR